MKNLIYLLLALPLLFTSCSNEDMATSEESVQVSFRAELPQAMGTRAVALEDLTVYCAVFENDVEIAGLRTMIDVVAGQPIVFAPRLVKGRTYDIAFWASKEGAYNVTDMTAICRTSPVPEGITEADYDAFTANATITVEGNHSQDITLCRPLALLNLGVTEEDWNGVANPDTFDLPPKNITLTISGVRTSFNALTGNALNSAVSDITYYLGVTGNDLEVNGKTYINIAQCYVLMDATKQNDSTTANLTYSIYSNSSPIRENAQIIHVPLQANHITNVVGGLLTGVVSYTITVKDDGAYAEEDNNKDI